MTSTEIKASIKIVLRSDWAPTLQRIARTLALMVAVAIIIVQWAQFTWRRPWAGLMALAAWRPAPAAPVAVEAETALLLPVTPMLLLAAAPEPIPAPVAAPARKRGRRATRQPKAVA